MANASDQQTPGVQTSVGGPDPNANGSYPAAATNKQKKQQAQGGPGLNKYLGGDVQYQDTMNQLLKAMQDYRAQSHDTLGQINQQFGSARQGLQQQRGLDVPQQQSDFASRGLIGSGLFAKASTDYQDAYQKQIQDLINGRQGNVTNVLNSLHQFHDQIQAQRDNARLEAIRRRAASLGVIGG